MAPLIPRPSSPTMAVPHTGHSLPSISPLPPIEMPESPTSSLSASNTPDRDHHSFMRRSSTSLASQNSFMTAMSSSPGEGTPADGPSGSSSPAHLSSLAPPQSLRKSFSVDSFVRREVPKSGTRTKRTNTDLAMPVPVLPPPGGSHDYEHRARQEAARSRGVSVSTQGDYEPSIAEDSDLELWPTSRRRASLKGKDQQQPFVRPGELKLPPRMPTLSSASSISTISTAPSSPREDYRRLHATTSMQSIPGRIVNPALASISGRARSGSLGVKVAGRPTYINIPSRPFSESVDPVTIAVVGAVDSGKSTVVRKGAKQFGLSDTTVHSAPPGMLGVHAPLRYIRRIGSVTDIQILGEMTPACPLHLLEIDIAHLGWGKPTSSPSSDSFAGAPQVDGVLICYDATAQSSFTHVEDLLKRLRVLKLPFMVLACKSDLERSVDPKQAHDLLQRYDSGLVEVTKESEAGKDRMRKSFQWLVKAILRERIRNDENSGYRNPASPEALPHAPPWDNTHKTRSSTDSSTVATPTASSSMTSMRTVAQAQAQASSSRLQQTPTMPTIPSPRSPSVPTSPTRARSTSDLLSEHERSKNQNQIRSLDRLPSGRSIMQLGSVSSDHLQALGQASGDALSGGEDVPDPKESEQKQTRPIQWATLDELLDKLLFLAVSGDDSIFISNFLLTYRRFASPRSVVLAMQKRMLALDQPQGDPMFACYAQMRICSLLEQWTENYPYDFTVRGTAGALSALVTAIIKKTYLLHYGSDLLPFTEYLSTYVDKDAAWALPVEDLADETDESYSLYEEEYEAPGRTNSPAASSSEQASTGQKPPSVVLSRERKSSLPLSNATSDSGPGKPSFSLGDIDAKKLLKDLVKNSQDIAIVESIHIADEITRIEAEYFLQIAPRDWLHYTLVSGKKDPETDPIARFNRFSEKLANWVVSLILCHDRPRHRAKQIEKFVEIAQKLRILNNYSALRAFVAGISNSTFDGDAAMEYFKTKTPELHKVFKSWDILFQAGRSHRAYRMALKSSKGGCIPALEVHMLDLIKAHEGNVESSDDHPNKIHWGKYNMIGKFVASTTQCQIQCKNAPEYNNIPDRPHIRRLLDQSVMDGEMQRSRIAPSPEEPFEETHRVHMPRTYSRDHQSSNQSREASNIVRKLFSW